MALICWSRFLFAIPPSLPPHPSSTLSSQAHARSWYDSIDVTFICACSIVFALVCARSLSVSLSLPPFSSICLLPCLPSAMSLFLDLSFERAYSLWLFCARSLSRSPSCSQHYRVLQYGTACCSELHRNRDTRYGRMLQHGAMIWCVAVCCTSTEIIETAVCCSVFQCVAVCCSVLQCVACVAVCCTSTEILDTAVCCSIVQCNAVCCSVLQCVSVRCSVLQRAASHQRYSMRPYVAVRCSVLAVCCSVLQCAALQHRYSMRPYVSSAVGGPCCKCSNLLSCREPHVQQQPTHIHKTIRSGPSDG